MNTINKRMGFLFKNSKFLKLILFFIVIIVICIIIFYKPKNKKNNNRNTKFTASLFAASDNPLSYTIKVEYTNTSSFGDTSYKYGGTLFYLVDYTDTTISHPDPKVILGQPYLLPNVHPLILDFDTTSGGKPDIINTNVIGYINRNFKSFNSDFQPTADKKYTLGISIMNDQPSASGIIPQIPNVYGDFEYIDIQLQTPPPSDGRMRTEPFAKSGFNYVYGIGLNNDLIYCKNYYDKSVTGAGQWDLVRNGTTDKGYKQFEVFNDTLWCLKTTGRLYMLNGSALDNLKEDDTTGATLDPDAIWGQYVFFNTTIIGNNNNYKVGSPWGDQNTAYTSFLELVDGTRIIQRSSWDAYMAPAGSYTWTSINKDDNNPGGPIYPMLLTTTINNYWNLPSALVGTVILVYPKDPYIMAVQYDSSNNFLNMGTPDNPFYTIKGYDGGQVVNNIYNDSHILLPATLTKFFNLEAVAPFIVTQNNMLYLNNALQENRDNAQQLDIMINGVPLQQWQTSTNEVRFGGSGKGSTCVTFNW